MTTPTRSTANIHKAAYLICQGLVPLEVQQEGRRYTFLFDDFQGKASQLLNAWSTRNVQVNADAYIKARQQVLNLINHAREETATPVTDRQL